MTTVERFDDGAGEWVEIDDYGSFEIEHGVSDVQLAPEATITVPRTADVSAGVRLRVREGSETIFEGNVTRTKPRRGGPMQVDAEHDAFGLFEETVDLTVSGTDEDVLEAALSEATGSWTLVYSGTGTSLGDTYEAEGRTVKRVFRDMVDRVGRVWWVDVDRTITVAPLGDGGQLASIDTSTDAATVTEYTPDDTDTVVNDVTVIGTGGEKVEGSATDAESIDEFGRKPERVNVDYIRSASEADDFASELLNPDPDASATVRVGASAAPVAGPVVNQTLDVTDTQGTGMAEELPIEAQTVTQGSAELGLGDGTGVNVAKFNRSEKSKADTTEPGSVYGNDRIGDNAIDTPQLVDTAVIESKLADLAVTTQKLQNNAVINGKLADLSVSETKIQDDSISTPKLIAEAVTAAKIEADTITAAQIAAGTITALEIETGTITAEEIAAGTITALEIAAGTITANEIQAGTLTAEQIDTLELDTGQLTISDSGTSSELAFTVDGSVIRAMPSGQVALGDQNTFFSFVGATDARLNTVRPTAGDNSGFIGQEGAAYIEMVAYDFIDASTGSSITDGGDPLAGLTDGHGPPESAKSDPDSDNYSLNKMARQAWDVIRAQQSRIESLEERLEALEADADPNA